MDGEAEAIPAPGRGLDDRMPSGGAARSGGPTPAPTCPFLSAIAADDRLGMPVLAADPANRCLSTGVPAAVLGRDQAALCLDPAYETCPQYHRATVGPTAEPLALPGRRISLPILAAVALLVAAAVIGGVSAAVEGDLSVGRPPSTGEVAASTATSPATVASSTPSAPAAVAVPTAAPANPVATPVPTASPTPVPTPTPAPATPVAYPGLTACAATPDCYVYVVKRGDTLTRIATRYGLTIDEILARNPTITDPSQIVRGQEIQLPAPRT
jgi:LysM repeat protein